MDRLLPSVTMVTVGRKQAMAAQAILTDPLQRSGAAIEARLA
jgi:hypothetical protein